MINSTRDKNKSQELAVNEMCIPVWITVYACVHVYKLTNLSVQSSSQNMFYIGILLWEYYDRLILKVSSFEEKDD